MPIALPLRQTVEKATVRLSTGQVRKAIEQGRGPVAKRISRRWYIRLDDYERWLAEQENS